MNTETLEKPSRTGRGQKPDDSGDPTVPQQFTLSGAPNKALLWAAKRVLSDPSDGSTAVSDLITRADQLAMLTLAVQEAAVGRKPEIRPSSTDIQLRKDLLDRLEVEVAAEGQTTESPSVEISEAAGTPSIQDVVESLAQIRRDLDTGEDVPDAETALSGEEGLQLVSEIAHDFRSPLTSILTLAETLRRGQSGEVNEVQSRQLGLIYSAALALSATASDFLELAQGGNRLAQKDPTPFSIAEILDSVRDIVYPMAEEKNLELHLDADVSDWRLGYPIALSRVLLNLTTNALKFTEEGFVEIVARSITAHHVVFSVRDTGRGIEKEARKTLFQPFRRTGSKERGFCFSGTGLGLAICRRLVSAMGSNLELETRPGWGTRFFFKLELPPADPLI